MTTAPPTWLPVIIENLPRELTDDPSWYPGLITPRKNKPGKWNKKPADPETAEPASWSDPTTRCTFDQAYMAYQRDPRFKCIGYMMHASGLIGIDLDDAIAEDGSIKPWAREIVDGFPGAYWERSISNTGLRGFCRGVLPEGVGGRKRLLNGCSVELYSDVRYLAVTGHALRVVEALPTLQAAVDALYARLDAGRSRATGTAAATGLTGRVTDLTPHELAIVEDVMGGRWSATMSEIWGRDELDAAGASEEDWVLEKEIAYWAIRRGLDGDALKLVVERIMRAGPYRSKWDEPRNGTTWLAQDVANAVQTTQGRLKKAEASGPTVEDDGEIRPEATPAPETLEQKVIRLERENRQLRATNAVQMTVINALRTDLDRERELRARDRRVALAEQRLDRVSQFSAGQKATIKAVAKIAPALANTHRVDDPIITRDMVAKVTGAKVDTAGDQLAVFDIAGSPIRRVDKPYGAKTLKRFELQTRDPAEIIERMAALGERLEKRPTATKTPRCRTCPEGTGTIVNIVCEGCGELLDERHVKTRNPAPDANVEKNSTLCPTPPAAVVEQVTCGGEKRHVADAPESDLDARAAAMVATAADRPVDPWKRPESRDQEPVDLGRIRFTRQQAADPEPPPSEATCTHCAEPVAPGEALWCAKHRDDAARVVMPWELPAAIKGAEE